MPSLRENRPFLALVTEKPVIFLLFGWFLVLAVLYKWYGIQIVHDSHRYLAYAGSFASGTTYWQNADSILYASYTLFLYFILYILSAPIGVVILLQLLIGTLAVICFYKATLNLTSSKISAFISTLLYISWPDLQQWHLYIHTESLYISFSLFMLYFLTIQTKTYRDKIIIFTLLLIALFLRPNGFFLTLGVGAYYLIGFRVRSWYSIKTLTALLILLIPALIYFLEEILEVFSPLQYMKQGQIIQGYNGINVPLYFKQVNYEAPVLQQITYTVLKQPFAFLKLLLYRFLFFLGHIRPYYSLTHNIIVIIFFMPVYLAAILGIKRTFINKKILAFIFVIIALQSLTVMIIAVDWDNRFVAPILPFVFIFAGIGFRQLIKTKVVSYYRF